MNSATVICLIYFPLYILFHSLYPSIQFWIIHICLTYSLSNICSRRGKKKKGIIPFKPSSSWNMGFKDAHSYPDSSQWINLSGISQRTVYAPTVPVEKLGTVIAAPKTGKGTKGISSDLSIHNTTTSKQLRNTTALNCLA